MSAGPPSIGEDVLGELERQGAACTGDVPALVATSKGAHPGFVDAHAHARALELALLRRAAAADRHAAWWLACAAAVVRASPLAPPQEDAELLVGRAFGELPQSAAARSPLPEGARWLVAGHAEPPATAHALELARKNAAIYVERLDAELQGRVPTLLARTGSSPTVAPVAIEVVTTYAAAATLVRASMARLGDRCAAFDPALAEVAARALAELDDAILPSLLARVEEARTALAAPAPALPTVERTSFVGAAPPTFATQSGQLAVAAPPSAAPASVEQLDAAMRVAFERAWTSRDPADRATFEAAVRARYLPETAHITDPDQQRRALDHYVTHALSQLGS